MISSLISIPFHQAKKEVGESVFKSKKRIGSNA